jgi:CubicO group peptidase (beta-lactamase class C family)
MKKYLLITVAVISCMATYAQINNPAFNPRDLQIIKKPKPIEVAGKVKPFLSQKPNPGDLKPGSGKAITFDSTWASRFQTVLDSVMEATNAKGASMAVYTPEEGLFTGVSGTSDGWSPITPQMRFGIGSNTKLFIAVTMVRLQEEGLLTLDDHLYQWLPSFPFVDSSTTIRQLLTHQSGIWDYWNDAPSIFDSIWADTSRFWTTEEIISSIHAPHFAPGNGYRYSNTNYVLAGMIIEAATGQTWVQKLHDIIFDPLNLDSTFVGAFEPRNGPVAAEWDAFFGQNTARRMHAGQCWLLPQRWYNGTTLCSTDPSFRILLCRWCSNLIPRPCMDLEYRKGKHLLRFTIIREA